MPYSECRQSRCVGPQNARTQRYGQDERKLAQEAPLFGIETSFRACENSARAVSAIHQRIGDGLCYTALVAEDERARGIPILEQQRQLTWWSHFGNADAAGLLGCFDSVRANALEIDPTDDRSARDHRLQDAHAEFGCLLCDVVGRRPLDGRKGEPHVRRIDLGCELLSTDEQCRVSSHVANRGEPLAVASVEEAYMVSNTRAHHVDEIVSLRLLDLDPAVSSEVGTDEKPHLATRVRQILAHPRSSSGDTDRLPVQVPAGKSEQHVSANKSMYTISKSSQGNVGAMRVTSAETPADAASSFWLDHAPATWRPYLRLMRLDRPIGTWLLFWPSVFGLALGAIADDRPFSDLHDVWLVVIFGIGAIVMRGAGCTYNDIVDRDIDARVARTRDRPLPSGAVTVRQAWYFLAAQCLVGLVILSQLNLLSIALGAASLILVAAYPFMKRITWWPQAWLGLTFNWGAILGFTAISERIDAADILLYVGLIFWTLGYDTVYALQDVEDDALVGVKSTARLFGQRSRDWILGFYAIAFTLVLAAGFTDHSGWPFGFLMLIAGGHLLWQIHLLDTQDPARCLRLFRANRDTGAMIAVALILASWAG